MWVEMLEYISGGRADGTLWPPLFGKLEVDDLEGERLIRGALARRTAAPPRPVPVPPPPLPVPEWAKPAAEFRAGSGSGPDQPVPPAPAPAVPHHQAPAGPDQPAPPGDAAGGPPQQIAPKAAWVEYAVSQGANPAEAAELTKAQLQASYGGRL
jgi:hypothetical protein